jgi:hypothetical protein
MLDEIPTDRLTEEQLETMYTTVLSTRKHLHTCFAPFPKSEAALQALRCNHSIISAGRTDFYYCDLSAVLQLNLVSGMRNVANVQILIHEMIVVLPLCVGFCVGIGVVWCWPGASRDPSLRWRFHCAFPFCL